MNDEILRQDVDRLGNAKILSGFAGSTILVTGSTGLIGSLFVKGLMRWNELNDNSIRVIALARNEEKAQRVFADYLQRDAMNLIVGDVSNLPTIDQRVDWICHGASITSSKLFAAKPVEVALTEIEGTRAVMELACERQVKGVVYLSSLEVYGDVPRNHGEVYEDNFGSLDWRVSRNSYPMSKRMCESLCLGYAREYGVPVRIARLAQTFGPGIAKDDNRVFAQFARAVVDGAPIIMHTPGEGCRCYCYTADAVEALAYILLEGQSAEAYNVANPATYCSVRDMAEMLVNRHTDSGVTLEFDLPDDIESFGYAAPSFVKLNADKLCSLGWSPKHDLPEMYDRLVISLGESFKKGGS